MTAGPAARLLSGFCSLAESWLAADRVRCEPYGGRFDAAELDRVTLNAPAVRAGCLAITEVSELGDGARFELRLAAAVVGRRTAMGEPSGGLAARLAARIAFELAREQDWPQAIFSEAERDEARTALPRGKHVGDPREIQAGNAFRPKIDKGALGLWTVTWMQSFLALPVDFNLPVPEPAALPHTVKSGFAPDIGPGHESDYDTLAEGSP